MTTLHASQDLKKPVAATIPPRQKNKDTSAEKKGVPQFTATAINYKLLRKCKMRSPEKKNVFKSGDLLLRGRRKKKLQPVTRIFFALFFAHAPQDNGTHAR